VVKGDQQKLLSAPDLTQRTRGVDSEDRTKSILEENLVQSLSHAKKRITQD
jgi:hypothetical protein